jgi:flagellin
LSVGISTGPALNSLAYYQQQLAQASNQASSGKRLTNASIDPSGLAIYNALTQQAGGAGDAINVAQGAASGIGDALSQLRSLAIEAGNGFNSPSDAAALRAQAISSCSRSTPMRAR